MNISFNQLHAVLKHMVHSTKHIAVLQIHIRGSANRASIKETLPSV